MEYVIDGVNEKNIAKTSKQEEIFERRCRLYHNSSSFEEFMINMDLEGLNYPCRFLNPFVYHYRENVKDKMRENGLSLWKYHVADTFKFVLNIFTFTVVYSLVGLLHFGSFSRWAISFVVVILPFMIRDFYNIYMFSKITNKIIDIKYEKLR